MSLVFVFTHIDYGTTFKYRYALINDAKKVIYRSKVYQSVNNQAEMINAHRRAIYEIKKLSRDLYLTIDSDDKFMDSYLLFDIIREKIEDISFEAFRRLNEELDGIQTQCLNSHDELLIEFENALRQSIEEDGN